MIEVMTAPIKPKIAICSSAKFYTEIIALSYKIADLGIEAVLPNTAEKMKQEGRENDEATTDWATSSLGYHGKSEFIRAHFDEITGCDAILVANYDKHGQANYIGPNVLMEMAVAFYLHKPVYILNDIPEQSLLLDEILGLEPAFLKGDTDSLSNLLHASFKS